MIELFYLLPYSSEYNPDELLNSGIKRNAGARKSPRTQDELDTNVFNRLNYLSATPSAIASFFMRLSLSTPPKDSRIYGRSNSNHVLRIRNQYERGATAVETATPFFVNQNSYTILSIKDYQIWDGFFALAKLNGGSRSSATLTGMKQRQGGKDAQR